VNLSGPIVALSMLRRAFLVVAVSGLAGVLVAGLALPIAAALGLVAKGSAEEFSNLSADLEAGEPFPERSRIVDAEGRTIATFFWDNRVNVPLEKIAPVMQEAVLAIEDHRYFEHGPIDFQGTVRAFMENAQDDTISGGGSTLTQQYVKQLIYTQADSDEERVELYEAATERSYGRKLRELRMAVQLEQELTKDEILEGYLNIANFGSGVYGVEAAARYYFSTKAEDLTLEQAAMLAGIVQNPSKYDPVRYEESALGRRNTVLTRMADPEVAMITPDKASEARASDLDLDLNTTPNGCVGTSLAPFYCEFVYQELMLMDELGATPEERDNNLRRGGLTVRTTLDRDAQRAASEAVSDRVAPTDVGVAALASVEPGTGEIKAMTHSRGYGSGEGETYYNYAVERPMAGAVGAQPGSTFKAFIVAAAIEQGIPLNTSIRSPYQINLAENSFETCDGPYGVSGQTWSPVNYSTSQNGSYNLMTGTEGSVNTFFAQLFQRTGMCDPVRIATEAGLMQGTGDPLVERPSIVLGGQEVPPLRMAEAYAMFANRGVHCASYAVTEVLDRDGETIYEAEPDCNRVLDKEVADAVNFVLNGVMENPGGTGGALRLADGRDAAGKTGTTNGMKAVWWVGYVPQLSTAVAVWGPDVDPDLDPPATPSMNGQTFNGEYFPTVSGARVPGPIWKQYMEAALEDVKKESFVAPDRKVIRGIQETVPDVRGMSESDARARLDDAGFDSYVEGTVDSEVAKGRVVRTNPAGGSSYGTGGSIGLILSSGTPPPSDDDEDEDDNGGPGGGGPGSGGGDEEDPAPPDDGDGGDGGDVTLPTEPPAD
jgi:membrane peptidoglycan carboxypeptidase